MILQLTTGTETKPVHLLQSQLTSPAVSTVTDLLPLEVLPPLSSPTAAAPLPNHPKSSTSPGTSPLAPKTPTSVPQAHKQSFAGLVSTVTKETIPASGDSVVKLGAPCREHVGNGKVPVQNMQSSASTQTSPNKAKTHPQQHVGVAQQKSLGSVATQSALPRQQLSQNSVKRSPAVAASQQPSANGHHHPVSSSVRHSTTQTASPPGHSHTHSHQPLPDVVKSAATSTTPHRATSGTAASKVPAHSCHKSLRNGGSIEPIKRVACTDCKFTLGWTLHLKVVSFFNLDVELCLGDTCFGTYWVVKEAKQLALSEDKCIDVAFA